MPARHFLVPLDLGDTTQPQLDYALGLGSKLKARLILMHVIHIPHFAQPELTPYMDAITDQTRQAINNHLQQSITTDVAVETVLAHGTPWQEIIHTAKRRAVDLIIVGTHARSGVGHALLGSVAEKIVRLASCPVLVIPSSASPIQ